MQTDKAIYIVFSSTKCGVGSFIRLMTGGFYNHVSVSFDVGLSDLYSFARFHKRAPLYAGFVHESGLRYSGAKLAPVKICRVPLTDTEYAQIEAKISSMMGNRDAYVYNLASAMAYPLKHKVNAKNAFTCIEFVTYLLDSVGFKIGENGSGFCSIKSLEELLKSNIVYEGMFPEQEDASDWRDDTYNKKLGVVGTVKGTLRNNARLIKRILTTSDRRSV